MVAPIALPSSKDTADPQRPPENEGDLLFTAVTLIVIVADVRNRGQAARAGKHDVPSSSAVTVTLYCEADDV